MHLYLSGNDEAKGAETWLLFMRLQRERATRTLSSWDEVFFLDADTMAAPTQSNKTVSEDVKGKYEKIRTGNGVAGGGGGSTVGERTGFLA